MQKKKINDMLSELQQLQDNHHKTVNNLAIANALTSHLKELMNKEMCQVSTQTETEKMKKVSSLLPKKMTQKMQSLALPLNTK